MSEQALSAKTKLIETAAHLVYRQGWNATGINQILTESKVPKGSFYYYFQTKDDLGAAIVRFGAQKLQDCHARTLLNTALSGRLALEKFFDEQLSLQRKSEWRYGCPIGSFSNEVAATTENIAQACREAFTACERALTVAITRGQTDRSLCFLGDAAKVAIVIAAAWQGGLLRMKTFQSEEPLLLTLKWIFRSLLDIQ